MNFTHANEAADALEAMTLVALESAHEAGDRGHDLLGHAWLCSQACEACARFGSVPSEEYEAVVKMLRHDLDHPVRRQKIRQTYALSWERVMCLARHPQAKCVVSSSDDKKAVLLHVQITIRSNTGREATACVRPLVALQGRADAYTPATVPRQPQWTERTSEGRVGEGPLGTSEAMRRGQELHTAVERELRADDEAFTGVELGEASKRLGEADEAWAENEFNRLAGMSGDAIMAEVAADGALEDEEN